MIIKQKNKYKSFNDYFFEADDDESNSPQVERYSIKPHKRRGNDYTAIEPDDDESNQSPEVLNDDNDQSSDYSETNNVPVNNQDNSGGNDAAVLDDDGGDEGSDYTDTDGSGADNTQDDDSSNQTDNGDQANDNDDAAILDDDGGDEGSDYTDTDGEGDGSNEEQSDDQGADNGDGSDQGNNNPPEPEAYRKFHLYQKYVSLYNYINKYTDRLQVASYDDIYVTSIVKLVIGKLNSLKKAVYQYLMLKFDKVSYVEAYIYYETCYNILKLSMDLLQNTMDKVKQ